MNRDEQTYELIDTLRYRLAIPYDWSDDRIIDEFGDTYTAAFIRYQIAWKHFRWAVSDALDPVLGFMEKCAVKALKSINRMLARLT